MNQNDQGSEPFISALRERLRQPSHGRTIQRPYAPELSYGRHTGPQSFDTRSAAVLLLLFPSGSSGARPRSSKSENWHIVLTERSPALADHGGQISFPGGSLDADETSEIAVLRELNEELGITAERVELVGCLSPVYVFASDFIVTPHVGITRQLDPIHPSPKEVARVLRAPLVQLMESPLECHTIRRGLLSFSAPHVQWHGHKIWGATLTMLGELLAIVREIGDPSV